MIIKFLLILPLVILSSCGGAKKIKKTNEVISRNAIWRQYEAKCADVAIPLDSKPLIENFGMDKEEEQTNFAYACSLEKMELLDFYIKEMERLGWSLIKKFDSDLEALLNFEKPSKVCSVSLRDRDKCREIFIFVAPK
ncbi:MAG: hypothetical protein UR26_C0002G0089 [candidate division TM6 bacterium GW2011_GWF2_32_72]|nr:MAG: hypothetical protein UR26_C0002G0089 [candidate division TM6 bacterium GW2011_GWF2_32_72]